MGINSWAFSSPHCLTCMPEAHSMGKGQTAICSNFSLSPSTILTSPSILETIFLQSAGWSCDLYDVPARSGLTCAAPPLPGEAFHGFPARSTKLQPPCSMYNRLGGSAGHSPHCLTLPPAQPHQTPPERAAPAPDSPMLCLLQRHCHCLCTAPREWSEHGTPKEVQKQCFSLLFYSSAQPVFSSRHGDVLEGILAHCLSSKHSTPHRMLFFIYHSFYWFVFVCIIWWLTDRRVKFMLCSLYGIATKKT